MRELRGKSGDFPVYATGKNEVSVELRGRLEGREKRRTVDLPFWDLPGSNELWLFL